MRARFLLALMCLVFLARQSDAAPHLRYIYPSGGQRGTTATVTLAGTELAGLTGFYTTGKGLTATLAPGKDAETRMVSIAVASDAPLGIQQIRFYDSRGLSNPRYFCVGAYPEVLEKEPNNTLKDALKVTLPVTINGRIQDYSDQDAATFHATAGQTIVCEVQALRILGEVGDSWLKGYLEIQDAAGNVLASNNGTSDDYYRWDPLIAFQPPKDGDYTLFFHDLNYRGDQNAVYRITVGVVPHALGIFPLGGQRGKSVNIEFTGPNLSDAHQNVALASDTPNRLDIAYAGPNGATNARPFQVCDLPSVMQNGSNHTRPQAQVVSVPCVVDGRILKDHDADYYKFHIDKKQKLAMETFSRRLGTPMDTELILYDATGKVLQTNDDERGKDSRIETDLEPGDYTVMVHDIDERGGPVFAYRLWLAGPQPTLRVRALPDAPKLTRGTTAVLNVHVDREDSFDGEVTVTVEGLPNGVTATPLSLAKDKQDGQITLTASATAPTGPMRLGLYGTGKSASRMLRVLARTEETYNIQGTAYQRELLGPILLVTEK